MSYETMDFDALKENLLKRYGEDVKEASVREGWDSKRWERMLGWLVQNHEELPTLLATWPKPKDFVQDAETFCKTLS